MSTRVYYLALAPLLALGCLEEHRAGVGDGAVDSGDTSADTVGDTTGDATGDTTGDTSADTSDTGRSCTRDEDCVDGHPCTLDTCVLGTCAHEPTWDGLCDASCDLTLARSVRDIVYAGAPPPQSVIASGTVVMTPTPCPECAGCPCTGGAQLADLDAGLELLTDPAATCTSAGGATLCTPIPSGPRFLVWGTTSYGVVPFAGGGAAVAPLPTALDVAGFCLAPSPDNVSGTYAARFSIEGEVAVTFTVQIAGNSTGAPLMRISDASQTTNWVDLDRFVAQAPVVGFIDGRLEIELAIPWHNFDEERERVHLYAHGDGFAGAIGPLFLLDADTLPFGELRLQRVVPDGANTPR